MDKKTITIAVVVIAVLAVGFGAWWWYQHYSGAPYQSNGYNTNSAGSSTTQTQGSSSSEPTMSYATALKIYANKRLQLNASCQVIPNYETFKKGTVIMLDNRANKARVVALDNTRYSVKAYGFILVMLTTNFSLPHTIVIDCGPGQNQGRILLQK